MTWPWNRKRKDKDEERLLKEQFRRRVKGQDPGPVEETTPTGEAPYARTYSGTDLTVHRELAPAAPVPEPGGEPFPGTIEEVTGVLPVPEPPAPPPALEPPTVSPKDRERSPRQVNGNGARYYGYELTTHVDARGRRTGLNGRKQARGGGGGALGVLRAIGSGVTWIFKIKPKFLIIERYLWAECFGLFALGAMGFTFFMLVTSIFSLGEKIFDKNIPPFTIAKVLILSAPAFLVLAIPVAVLFATLMGMNRLNRDNELIAFATNGISLYRIFIPFIAMGIMAGVMTWLIYEHVVPVNNKDYKETLKVFWEAAVVDFIKPEIVIKAPQRKYFYVDSINKTEGVMYGLRLYDYYAGEGKMPRSFPRVFVAERAWVADKYLVLSNVKLYDLDEDRGDTLVCATMPEISIDIGTRTKDYFLEPHPTELTAEELRNRITRVRDRLDALRFPAPNMRTKLLRDWTEYYFKFSIPLACLAFVLVAVPVSLRGPRDERNLGLVMTFILVMAYYIIFFIARTLGSRGVILTQEMIVAGKKVLDAGSNLFPPQVAGWLAPGIFLLASIFLIARARR